MVPHIRCHSHYWNRCHQLLSSQSRHCQTWTRSEQTLPDLDHSRQLWSGRSRHTHTEAKYAEASSDLIHLCSLMSIYFLFNYFSRTFAVAAWTQIWDFHYDNCCSSVCVWFDKVSVRRTCYYNSMLQFTRKANAHIAGHRCSVYT